MDRHRLPLGEILLETGRVDAVLTMAPDPEDRWRPMPVIVTDARDMAVPRHADGLAPSWRCWSRHGKGLSQARGHRHPLPGLRPARRSKPELGFERLYVIGTPCSDNTTTERFHEFLALLAEDRGQ